MKKILIIIILLSSCAMTAQKKYDLFDKNHKQILEMRNKTEKQVDSFLSKNQGAKYYVRVELLVNGEKRVYDCPHYEPKNIVL